MKKDIYKTFKKDYIPSDLYERRLLGNTNRSMMKCFKYMKNSKRTTSPRRHKMWTGLIKKNKSSFAFHLGYYIGYKSRYEKFGSDGIDLIDVLEEVTC